MKLLYRHKVMLFISMVILFLSSSLVIISIRSLMKSSKTITLQTESILSAQAKLYFQQIAKQQADTVRQGLAQVQKTVGLSASILSKELNFNKATIETTLESLRKNGGDFCITAFFVPANRSMVYLPGNSPLANVPGEYFFSDKASSTKWGEVHLNRLSPYSEIVVDAYVPVIRSGNFVGHIGISVSLWRIISQFNAKQPILGSASFIVDDKEFLLAAPPHARVKFVQPDANKRDVINLKKYSLDEPKKIFHNMALGGENVEEILLHNDMNIIAYAPIKDINWRLGIVANKELIVITSRQIQSIIKQEFSKFLYTFITWTVIVLILFLIVSNILSKNLTDPIRKMAILASKFKKGDFTSKIDINRNDEIGELADALNKMAKELQKSFSMLEQKVKERTAELRDSNNALIDSEERYRGLSDAAFEGILFSEKGIFIEANTSAAKMFDYEQDELIGVLAADLVADEYKDIVTDKIMSGYDKPYEAIVQRKDGSKFWTEIHGKTFDYHGKKIRVTSVRDITDQKKLQEEALKASKLKSLGILAGGIAHDFNNLLFVIMGNISLAKDDLKTEIEAFENLRAAEEACITAKELSAKLVTFSKGGDPVKRMMSIDNLLKNTVISVLNGFNLKSNISLADSIRQVNIDENQIKQVIRNIVVNAKEAMDDKGQLKVSCKNIDIAKEGYLTLSQGKYIKISFEDQGCGISKENLKKIFDPYFSTKDMGINKGQGIELTISYSIIEKHGGLISVNSELGTGSIFSIYLPAVVSVKEIDLQKPEKKPAAPKLLKQPAAGTGKILLMDDKKAIRAFLGKAINRLGYDIETCTEGRKAVEIYKKAMELNKPFDVAILDLTNKFGMGGKETMKRILEVDPDARGIVITAYSDDPVVANFRAYGFSGFLVKPTHRDELGKVINEVLSKNQ